MQFSRVGVGTCVFLFLVVASLSSIPQARAQYEVYAFGGEVCQTRNPAIKNVRRVNGTLMNISESNTFNVSCPIFSKTQEYEGPESTVDLEVTLYFSNLNSLEKEVRCVFSELVWTGVSHVKKREVVHMPGNSGAGPGGFIRYAYENFSYGGLHEESDGMPHVSCKLPPQTKIIMIEVLSLKPE